MSEVKVNVTGKENLTWPSFCVLCLKPNPEEKYETGGLSIPYCHDCHAKVKRFEFWGENFALG